jgi:hypothetical protein
MSSDLGNANNGASTASEKNLQVTILLCFRFPRLTQCIDLLGHLRLSGQYQRHRIFLLRILRRALEGWFDSSNQFLVLIDFRKL